MKVAIGYDVVDGPWGGGNRFVKSLCNGLVEANHKVVYSLDDDDIDVIVMIDPRRRIPNIPFGAGNILRYLLFTNKQAVVLHRINECDERKNTKTVNFRLRLANYAADHTAFVGSWLKALPIWVRGNSSVILNGADPLVFNPSQYTAWNGTEPLKLVTHHWGGNWMKGFDVYEKIDGMLANPEWKEKIDFTYIGNVPKGFKFNHVRHVPPMDAAGLAKEISSHHVYLTASINEPGGNHQNEGGLCGLPFLYRNSGCLPEYCDGYGVMFNGPKDFDAALKKIIAEYSQWCERIRDYPCTIEHTIASYIQLLESMHADRENIAQKRKLWRNPLSLFLNQLPI